MCCGGPVARGHRHPRRSGWHSHNLPLEDNLGEYYSVGVALLLANAAGPLAGAKAALGYGPYVLQPLIAAALHDTLALEWSLGPVLDGLWMIVAAMAIGWFFWRRTRSLVWSPLLALVPLLHPILLRDPGRGVISLHADYVGTVLGFAVIALLLASHRLRRPRASTLAGLLFRCLILGRWATAVLVAIMCLPLAWAAVSSRGRAASFRGALLFVGAAICACAWWLPFRLRFFFEYFYVWYGRHYGNIGQLHRSNTARFLYSYCAEVLGGRSVSLLLLLALALFGALARRRAMTVKTLNWPFLWLAVGPLVVLLLLRSDHAQYAYPASLGVFLTLLFPTRASRRPVVCTSRGGRAFVPAVLGLWSISLFQFGGLAAGSDRDKLEAVRIGDEIRRCEARPCRVGIVYWGALNAQKIANVLLYDHKAAAALADHLRATTSVDYLVDGRLAFPPDVLADKPPVVPRCYDRLVVLSEASWAFQSGTPFPYHWPRWARLSEAVLRSGLYEGSETVYSLRAWEKVHVLRRIPGASACIDGQLR